MDAVINFAGLVEAMAREPLRNWTRPELESKLGLSRQQARTLLQAAVDTTWVEEAPSDTAARRYRLNRALFHLVEHYRAEILRRAAEVETDLRELRLAAEAPPASIGAGRLATALGEVD